MPTWWIVGVAVYVPLFLGGVVHMIREGDLAIWTAIWASVAFLAVSTASGFFWFG